MHAQAERLLARAVDGFNARSSWLVVEGVTLYTSTQDLLLRWPRHCTDDTR